MIKRVIVFNNMALLQPNTEDQYYDYFSFIEPGFKKTFYTLFNNEDVPQADAAPNKRWDYYNNELDKIITALNKANIHSITMKDLLEKDNEILTLVKTIMSLYLCNYTFYELHERENNPDLAFQDKYMKASQEMFDTINLEKLSKLQDEYIFLYQFLIRKLLWYYTSRASDRDEKYLDGTVTKLLNYITETGEWYNNYEAHALDKVEE